MRRVLIELVGLVGLAASCGTDEATPTTDPPGSCVAPRPEAMGEATYYNADGSGNCSFDASPNDLMVAAMNAPDYDHAAWCGGCVEVTGPAGVVTVRIVDQCPGCQAGDLDLSREAFARIAALSAGRVPITWHEVACDVTGPIAYQHKDGTSQYYTAIQVRNHRYPIATLEAQDAAGAWTALPRADYNYFIPTTPLGPGPYAFRAHDVRGHVLEDLAIPLVPGAAQPGAAQFPTCP
ncbi:MAG: expansin EXLX1 family cellulose-binding protein [Proteobacteria bacterium]|nr:expansin EXLX1 family cellulose-binding protein [Pseudomonadota bacterium]